MSRDFTFPDFLKRFATDDICLEEIKKLRYPGGITCSECNKITKHYKVRNRTAYVCKICRHNVYPLKSTIFEKTTTPLRVWFYALFIMTFTRATISVTNLQRELGVTYKTAWRMYAGIHRLMQQNNGDLLIAPEGASRILRWTFLNKLEFTVTEKKAASE